MKLCLGCAALQQWCASHVCLVVRCAWWCLTMMMTFFVLVLRVLLGMLVVCSGTMKAAVASLVWAATVHVLEHSQSVSLLLLQRYFECSCDGICWWPLVMRRASAPLSHKGPQNCAPPADPYDGGWTCSHTLPVLGQQQRHPRFAHGVSKLHCSTVTEWQTLVPRRARSQSLRTSCNHQGWAQR